MNHTPGQSASAFRMFLDKSEVHTPATEAEVKVGSKFHYKGMTYEIDRIKGDDVYMEAFDGWKRRSTIIPLMELTKSGSEYRLLR